MLIIASSRSEKSSELLNLIKKQYVYVKDINESKYQYLIKKRENSGLENMKIQRLLLNIQTICRISIKILKSTAQV